ncbi:MAG: dihydropteroate synthase [Candidatus Eremiobacteraeota bacterium]|nr:dihydropteroate synthase [Candidatus Eremiobacteraeota bacterium]
MLVRTLPERGVLRIGDRAITWGERTIVMGIVNVTPDSFSGDGRQDAASAVNYAVAQWQSGADIIDIGGESTRPGHEPIDEATEIARIVPVIAAVRARIPHAIVSIDTYKPKVARAAREAGADMINSVWGAPDALIDVAVELAMPLAAMHNQHGTSYAIDVVDAVRSFLDDCARRATRRGLPAHAIVLDPGIGFGKTPEHNIRILRCLKAVCDLGFPTMLGTSRKSTIGKLTHREPHERIYGTAATTALAIAAGIDIVRVHDVAQNRDVVSVSDAIVRGWRPCGWTG